MISPRGEAEDLADGRGDRLLGDGGGAEGLDHHRDRLGHADGVGHLHLAAGGQAGGHHVLGDVAPHVGGRAVDLGGVLAAEGAAAVAAHAAVGVDDDLAAGDAGVAHGAADDEAAGGVDEDLGLPVERASSGSARAMTSSRTASWSFLLETVVGVLGGDHHRVDARHLAVPVLDA